MPTGGPRSLCAVHAFGAFCAECGDAGKVYSCAAAGTAPWSTDAVTSNVMELCPGASAKRTVETFASMFGWSSVKADADGKLKGAAFKLHQRSADVKQALARGAASVQQLHATLSVHALQASQLHGTGLVHTHSGACPACAAHLPLEYAALQPQLAKAGPPCKKKRAGRADDNGPPRRPGASPPRARRFVATASSLATRRRRLSLAARSRPLHARHRPPPFLALAARLVLVSALAARCSVLVLPLALALSLHMLAARAAAPGSPLAAAASSPADALALALRGERLCVRHARASVVCVATTVYDTTKSYMRHLPVVYM